MTPDGISQMLLVIEWLGDGVVDGGDDYEKPCEDGEDFVRQDSLDIVGVAASEWV